MVSLQGLRQGSLLLGHHMLATKHHDGWLSLATLCTAPSIRKWFQKHAPSKLHSMETRMDHLLQAVTPHLASPGIGCSAAPRGGMHLFI